MPLRRPLLSTGLLFARTARPTISVRSRIAPFHTSPIWKSEPPDFYKTLDLDPGASAGDIKKQFYTLSKTHHPDHNPNDPQASERFVKISEAYAILGSPQNREKYDRDTQRSQAPPPHARRGSHSSASAPFGSRPASGLSKRRTQFKGPPPSFYRSGGWGAQSSKRQAQAEAAASGSTGEQSRGGGFGPGQGQSGFDYIPHFDREGHQWTQEQQDQRRRRRQEEGVGYAEGGSTVLRFFVITAVVMFAFSIPTMFDTSIGRRRKKDESL